MTSLSNHLGTRLLARIAKTKRKPKIYTSEDLKYNLDKTGEILRGVLLDHQLEIHTHFKLFRVVLHLPPTTNCIAVLHNATATWIYCVYGDQNMPPEFVEEKFLKLAYQGAEGLVSEALHANLYLRCQSQSGKEYYVTLETFLGNRYISDGVDKHVVSDDTVQNTDSVHSQQTQAALGIAKVCTYPLTARRCVCFLVIALCFFLHRDTICRNIYSQKPYLPENVGRYVFFLFQRVLLLLLLLFTGNSV